MGERMDQSDNKNRYVEVTVFSFNDTAIGHNKQFNRDDVLKFLSSDKFKKDLETNNILSFMTHRSRTDNIDILTSNNVPSKDLALVNGDIVGIVRGIYVEGEETKAVIELLDCEKSNYLLQLISNEISGLAVSIAFMDSGTSNKFKISSIQGIDFTMDPAMKGANVAHDSRK